jgi:hypothetical protein
MSPRAVDKKLSTCCNNILRKKIHWFAEIGVPLPSNILQEVIMDPLCKIKLNLLFLRKTRVTLFSVKAIQSV